MRGLKYAAGADALTGFLIAFGKQGDGLWFTRDTDLCPDPFPGGGQPVLLDA